MKTAFLKLALCALPLGAALPSQAQSENSGGFGSMLMNSVKKALNKNGVGQQDAAGANGQSAGGYQKLTDTKLKDLFKAYPVRDDMNPPAFPKVAIRILSHAKSLGQWETRSNTPNECVDYQVTLWTDERSSEKFDKLRMCATDLAFDISYTTVRSPWPVKFNYNKNSGQVRDDGPVAPKQPYPTDPVARNFMYGGGVFYIGSMFVQMGYAWEYPHDTMRVWVSGVSADGKVAPTPVLADAGAAKSGGSAEPGEYINTPTPGLYDGSDRNFERSLLVMANGRFELKVSSKAGGARAGAGDGQLTDAPGGWSASNGSCRLSLKRAAGAVRLSAEGCASAWGDAPFDGRYQFKGAQS
ncbi:hypothetical protein RQP53_05075 [Paucibacter sp. APW11]|uniref:Uncharacterized protein n=1 Tax=Roseateles aquae TaxID=3077235 RepID=A0ABU3P8V3_9BURK|nr:hypothetical protein [Paucibacter sp. APW11]MDT8998640.1 hypothetical protein [Paucibacter sp. APW11]